MNMKKFNIHGEDRKEKIKKFHEILDQIDKNDIIEAFKTGVEIGFWGNLPPESDLYLQFNDGMEFVYTIIRMPIRHIKKNPTSPISTSILEGKKLRGHKF